MQQVVKEFLEHILNLYKLMQMTAKAVASFEITGSDFFSFKLNVRQTFRKLPSVRSLTWCTYYLVKISARTGPSGMGNIPPSIGLTSVLSFLPWSSGFLSSADHLVGLVVKVSSLRVADPGSIPAFRVRIFPDQIIPAT